MENGRQDPSEKSLTHKSHQGQNDSKQGDSERSDSSHSSLNQVNGRVGDDEANDRVKRSDQNLDDGWNVSGGDNSSWDDKESFQEKKERLYSHGESLSPEASSEAHSQVDSSEDTPTDLSANTPEDTSIDSSSDSKVQGGKEHQGFAPYQQGYYQQEASPSPYSSSTASSGNKAYGSRLMDVNAFPKAINPTKIEDLKGLRILVVGLARTGVALCRALANVGAKISVSDHKSKAELVSYLEKMEGVGVTYELGGHTPKTFLAQDIIILSPGISPNLKIFEYARSQGVRVTGEFEFISRFIDEPIVAVTGTNGKTTVCSLIKTFLEESGISCWVGGSFGEPLSTYLQLKNKAQVVITEVSSFQLEHVEKFNPQNIVFTNLAENHLDRYKLMEGYVNAKRQVFLNTNSETTSILNADDSAVVELARDQTVQRGRILYFSRKAALEPQIMHIGGAVVMGDQIHVRTDPAIHKFYMGEMKLMGAHSQENMMAAILAAREHGATSEAIHRVMARFAGLPHRLEYVRKVGGVKFYNDSKATNVHAVQRALDSFDENVILVMGGKDTNLDYTPLGQDIRRRVKNLILVGEAKERINRDIGDFSETFLIGTFEEAILIAYQKSRIDDTVLLSPGCSSFDIFDNYIERGNYFKSIVNKF